MFQDIAPYKFHNEFQPREATSVDYVIVYKDNKVLLQEEEGALHLPLWGVMRQHCPSTVEQPVYLFSVDQSAFYLAWGGEEEMEGFSYHSIQVFRELQPSWLAFAGATAMHLAHWYDCHHYCGKCAAALEYKTDERAVICPACGAIEYPKISPVVIVGVVDGDNLLLTRYANRGYTRYSLIAGFMEIGETFEDTVRREVLEEVGLHVKNVRYYKSQPWAFSESVLAGFYADVEGDKTIHIDEDELAEGVWIPREELPVDDIMMSLTWEMIQKFRQGAIQ